ncbi:MAG: hypothetical protein OES24_12065 [Acidimicrobiia bacterium]|nr:hypothetical protein [Acidimicrobiia bacterium]
MLTRTEAERFMAEQQVSQVVIAYHVAVSTPKSVVDPVGHRRPRGTGPGTLMSRPHHHPVPGWAWTRGENLPVGWCLAGRRAVA